LLNFLKEVIENTKSKKPIIKNKIASILIFIITPSKIE
jgi:hypothetical protein